MNANIEKMANEIANLGWNERDEFNKLVKNFHFEKRFGKSKEQMKSEIILPGIYMIEEPDNGGYRNYKIMKIKVNEEISKWDLALKIYQDKNYISPWPYITITKFEEPKSTVNVEYLKG